MVDQVSDKDKDEAKELKVSQVKPEEMQKIAYMTSLDHAQYNQEYRANLEAMMNMGLFDFKKNL